VIEISSNSHNFSELDIRLIVFLMLGSYMLWFIIEWYSDQQIKRARRFFEEQSVQVRHVSCTKRYKMQ